MKVKLLFVLMLGVLLSSCTPWAIAQTDDDVYTDSVNYVDTECYSRVYFGIYWGFPYYPYPYYYPYYYSYYYWPDYYYYYPYYYPYYHSNYYYHSRPHHITARHHYSFHERRPMNTHRTQISNTSRQIRRQPIKREQINTRQQYKPNRNIITRKPNARGENRVIRQLDNGQSTKNSTPKVHTRPTGNTSKQSVSQSHRSSARPSAARKR